ncbi:MAG TPA: hypothetical protein VLL97_05375 [Acidobacteriota bacterium]|nr:hypothetical protein [Acidobacteriota bacterium]
MRNIFVSHARRFVKETGAALLVALIVLSLCSLLGVFLALNANTGLIISDNYESRMQASYAALAGLDHASALLRGLGFDEILRGPDGRYDQRSVYMNDAKTFGFRLPVPLPTARTLNITDPAMEIAGIPDDGIINTGFYSGTSGAVLIPVSGIAMSGPDPSGYGTTILSRYFVKATDNNGEASELQGDSENNPFVDGDGVVIVRSVGVARTLSLQPGSVSGRNSVVVYEAKLKRLSMWNIGPALTVLGSGAEAVFSGAPEISGGSAPGIGTVSVPPGGGLTERSIREAAKSVGLITGGGIPHPSVLDITGGIVHDPDAALLLDPLYLWNFIHRKAPKFADYYHMGNQSWTAGRTPYLGFYDAGRPWNAPGQDPKVTVIDGDLTVSGGFSGGGLLIIAGDFSCIGPVAFNGLILVIGTGRLEIAGSGPGITGGVVVGRIVEKTEKTFVFGEPEISIGGDTFLLSDREVIKMAVSLIPAGRISFREIAGVDP